MVWCKKRYLFWKRRDYLLGKLRNELDIIKFRVQFIEEIIEDKRVINKKKKDVIIKELEDSNYPKFSEKIGGDASYDYLIKMELLKLTYEEIEKLKAQRDKKQAEYDTLEGKTDTGSEWIEDINDFEESWDKSLIDYEKEHSGDVEIKKKNLKSEERRQVQKNLIIIISQ